jgi:hypothetical protein
MESKEVSGKQAIHYRNYGRARDKALVRLAHLYTNTYKQLLDEQKEVLMSKRARLGLLAVIVGLLWAFIPEQQHTCYYRFPRCRRGRRQQWRRKRENKALAVSYAYALGYK